MSRRFGLLALGLLVSAATARAELQQTVETNLTSQTDFEASFTDLVDANQRGQTLARATVTGFIGGGYPDTAAAALNDGLIGQPNHGPSIAFQLESAESDGEWRAEFALDTERAPQGYDITAIRTTAGWSDGKRVGQTYEVSFQTVDNEKFQSLGVFRSALLDYSGDCASRLTITNTSGAIATRVKAVRFDLRPTGGLGTVWRELDVWGQPSGTARTEP